MSRPSLGVVVGRSLMFGISVAVVVALAGTLASGSFVFTRFATSFVVGLSYALAIGLSVSFVSTRRASSTPWGSRRLPCRRSSRTA